MEPKTEQSTEPIQAPTIPTESELKQVLPISREEAQEPNMYSSIKVSQDLHWVGARDPDLRVFDIIMDSAFGTSYNSYVVVCGEEAVLIDTTKNKEMAAEQLKARIKEAIGDMPITHIIVNHTEPDHSSEAVKLALETYPGAVLHGSTAAINFLSQISNVPVSEFPHHKVKTGDVLTVGDKSFHFTLTPWVHWGDTMITHCPEVDTVFTCDLLGAHYCPPEGVILDTQLSASQRMDARGEAFKYYYDCIMGPFPKHVINAIQAIRSLEPQPSTIAVSHGPVHDTGLEELMGCYEQWAQSALDVKRDLVLVPYVSAYGFSKELAEAVAAGAQESGLAGEVRLVDMVYTTPAELMPLLPRTAVLVVGSPTINKDALPMVKDLLGALSPLWGSQVYGAVVGSYGWSGEGIKVARDRMCFARLKMPFSPIAVRFRPKAEEVENARLLGERLCLAAFQGERFQDFTYERVFGIPRKGSRAASARSSVPHTPRKSTGTHSKVAAPAPGAAAGMYNDGVLRLWRCIVCGEIITSVNIPEICPVCEAGADAFVLIGPAKKERPQSDYAGHILVLGGGPAAVTAAAEARVTAPKAEITILSADSSAPYNRTRISEVLVDPSLAPRLALKPAEWYAENRIELRLNSKATSVDYDNKKVTFKSSGQEHDISFDRLILATGAVPFIPPGMLSMHGTPVEPAAVSNVGPLRTLQDIQAINKACSLQDAPQRLVLIGGGVLAMEAVPHLIAALPEGSKVTVLERAPHILAAQLAPPAAKAMTERVLARANGALDIRVGVNVKVVMCDSVDGKIHANAVQLADGSVILADIVMICIGVRPRVPQSSSDQAVELSRGTVLLDECCNTSIEGVYAAGDCAMVRGRRYGATYPRALEQARVAGANAAGGAAKLGSGAACQYGYQLNVWDCEMVCIGSMQHQPTDMVVTMPITTGGKPTGRVEAVFREGKLSAAVCLGNSGSSKLGMKLVQAARAEKGCAEVLAILQQ
eukprot:gnl/Dysnectes_brevis/82_a101_5613.p1 GENE.gnl/Dysnectes_brevis/82_a101_5613~~gnl/Dysnectes_brevis/82_a101_5613.p1  ORF type:complete len:989 (+),score=372.74 gnl/Dysnectes_brevis/82_a101_5613:45-3011(+)